MKAALGVFRFKMIQRITFLCTGRKVQEKGEKERKISEVTSFKEKIFLEQF